MSKKSWKDHLLSSGVPLEYSVAQVYESLGISSPSEFQYERVNADGVSQVFSVDLGVTDADHNRDLQVENLVECKYRHDGTNWIFTPRQYERSYGGAAFGDLFVALDAFCPERKINVSALNKFHEHYPLCGKGIELLPDDANPKTIEQAVQQLRYAVVAKAIENISYLSIPWSDQVTLVVIVPIIVTTAQLWRLKVGVTIEEIRKAEELSEVADHHDIVVLWQEPNELESKHTKRAFFEAFSENETRDLEGLLKSASSNSFGAFVSTFLARKPSLFMVISYPRIKSALTNLHKFFTQPSIVVPRVKKT